MTNYRVSRRDVFGLGAAATATAVLTAGPAAAATADEAEALRARIGERFDARGESGAAEVVLEEVVALTPRARLPLALDAPAPFAAVFRQTGGEPLAGGVYHFQGGRLPRAPVLMVTAFAGADGRNRLEAVFN